MFRSKLLIYCFGLSVIFLICHALVLMLKLSDGMIFGAILLFMCLTQYLAYRFLKRTGQIVDFKSIFSILCITQIFSIILLTLYAAYNPFGETKPVKGEEIVSSVLLFALLLPLLLTSIIWFLDRKKKQQS